MSKRFYRPELDVVRFVACLLVFLYHGLHERDLSTPLGAFIKSCSFGVCLFFTLSAYLITLLLLKEKESTGTIHLKQFYMRRALRIWPLYFGALAGSAVIAALHGQLHAVASWYLAAMFMVGNIFFKITSAIHLWSISVEEQFYIFWPSLMKHVSRKRLVWFAVLLIGLANATLFYFGITPGPDYNIRVWMNSLVQMDFFGAGILLALREKPHESPRPAVVTRLFAFAGCAAALLIAVYVLGVGDPVRYAKSPAALCLGYDLVAVACVTFIHSMRGLERWPRLLTYLGKISFGLYVFSFPAQETLQPRLAALGEIPAMLAVALLVGLVAAASYEFYEKPFLLIKKRYEIIRSRPVG